jgi:hypothetical protein
VSPVRKPQPSVVIERRETDDPIRERRLVQLLAKLVADKRRSGAG